MSKAVNQNDLIHIVNSHVGAVTDIMGVILSAMENNDFTLDTSVKDKTEKFKGNIDAILGENGVFTVISSAIERANNLPSKDSSAKAAENFVGGIDMINKSIKALNDVNGLSQKKTQKIMQSLKYISIILDVYYQTMSDFDADKLNKIPVESITKVIDALKSILLIFKDITMGYLLSIPIKIWLLKRATKKILKYFLWLSGVEIKKGFGKGRMIFTPYQIVARLIPMLPAFAFMQIALICLLKVVKQIHETKIGWFIFGIIKLWFLKKFTKRLFKFFNAISEYYYMNNVGQGIDQQSLMKLFLKMYICVWFMKAIVANVAKMSWVKLIGAWLKIGFYRNVFKNISITMSHLRKTAEDAFEAAGPRYMRLIKLYIVFIILKKIVRKISKMGFFRMIIASKNIKRIRQVFLDLKKVLRNIQELDIDKNIIPKLWELRKITRLIKKVVKQVRKTKRTKSVLRKLGRIADIFGHSKEKPLPGQGSIYQIMNRVRRWTIVPAIKKMSELLQFVVIVKLIIKTINSIKASKKLLKKLGKIENIFGDKKFTGRKAGKKSITGGGSIADLIKGARNLPSTTRAVKKLLKTTVFILTLGQTILALLLLVPLMLLFALGAPIILMGVWLLGKVLKVLAKIVRHISPGVFESVYKLTILVAALCLLGLGLIMLGFLSSLIIDSIGGILLFFVIVGVLAMACWGLSYLAPIIMAVITPILGVIGMMALIVFLMLAVAAMLWLLGKIELDQEQIITNVKIVLKTAWCIIENVFAGDDADSEENDKGFAASLLEWVFKGIGAILVAVLAVAYIALIFIAVAFILLIASMLRLLQILELDPDQISKNVGIVLATAQEVINSVFEHNEEEEEKSDRTYLEAVLEHIGSGLVMIIQAIMAVIYLALITFAIAMILVISGMLRLLQELELDEEKINTNVNLVFKTAEQVVTSVFDPEDDKDNPSKKDWVADAIEYFFGGLAKILLAIMAIAYLALIMVSIALITGIAAMLRGLQEIELDDKIITQRVKLVCETANLVIDTLFDYRDDKDNPSKKGFLRSLFSWIGLGPLIKILDAIMAIAYLALISACIGIIKTIAENLMTICDVDFSNVDIKQKVQDILDAAAEVMSAVFDHKDPKEKPLDSKWDNFCKTFLGDERFAAYRMLGWLSFISAATAAIADMANNMTTIFEGVKVPNAKTIETIVTSMSSAVNSIMSIFSTSAIAQDKFYVNQYGTVLRDAGHDAPDGFKKQDWTDMATQLVKNLNGEEGGDAGINTVIKALCDFAENISKVTEYSWAKSIQTRDASGRKITPPYLSVIKGILHIPIDVITTISEAANELDKYDLKDYNTNMDKFDAIMNRVWAILGSDPKKMEKDNANLESRIKMVKEHTDNLIRFMDKISSMDLTKMQTAENLFKHMAEFSTSINGNFDKLAEALNDKIAPLLEEFNGLLKETPAKITSNMNELLGIEDNSTGDTSTVNNSDNNKMPVKPVFPIGMQQGKGSTQQGKGNVQQVNTKKAKKTGATIQDIYNVLVGQGEFTDGVKVHNS